MTIELIVIGKTDSKEIAALVELYAQRVNHYCRFAVTALPDVRNTKSMTVRQQRTAEGEAILRQLADGDYVTLLDEQVDANAALAWRNFKAGTADNVLLDYSYAGYKLSLIHI